MKLRKSRLFLFPAFFGAAALPMFIGFAGTDALAGRWDRVERSASRLVSLSPAAAADATNECEFLTIPLTPDRPDDIISN